VANVDDIMRDQEHNPQHDSGAILAVSRDENKNRYGARSYTPKVNKEFRPPLIYPDYDLNALSRLPRPKTSMTINPDTSEISQVQNIHGMDVSSMIDERVLQGSIRPSWNIPFEQRQDYILPDLKLKLPPASVRPTMNTPMNEQNNECKVVLKPNNPQVSAHAGVDANGKWTNFHEMGPLDDIQLDYKGPKVSADARVDGTAIYHAEPDNRERYTQLDYVRPQTSARVNLSSHVNKQDYEPQVIKIQNPLRSMTSVHTNKDVGLQINMYNETPTLRPTLTYNRAVDSCPVLPTGIHHFVPKLKPKRM